MPQVTQIPVRCARVALIALNRVRLEGPNSFDLIVQYRPLSRLWIWWAGQARGLSHQIAHCHIKLLLLLLVHRQVNTKAYFHINPSSHPLFLQWTCEHMYCVRTHTLVLDVCAYGSCSIKRAFLAMAAKRGRRKSERGRSLQLQDLINFKIILSSTESCFRWSNMNWQRSCFFTTTSPILSLLIIYHLGWPSDHTYICSWLALSICIHFWLIYIYHSSDHIYVPGWLSLKIKGDRKGGKSSSRRHGDTKPAFHF